MLGDDGDVFWGSGSSPSGPKTHSFAFSEHIRDSDSTVFHVDVLELLKGSQRLFRGKMFLSLFQTLLLDQILNFKHCKITKKVEHTSNLFKPTS